LAGTLQNHGLCNWLIFWISVPAAPNGSRYSPSGKTSSQYYRRRCRQIFFGMAIPWRNIFISYWPIHYPRSRNAAGAETRSCSSWRARPQVIDLPMVTLNRIISRTAFLYVWVLYRYKRVLGIPRQRSATFADNRVSSARLLRKPCMRCGRNHGFYTQAAVE